MSTIKFLQGDCLKWMNKISTKGQVIDVVLTSPPYNTGRPSTSERSRGNHEGRYDIHMDTMTNQEYCDWCVNIFNHIDKILKPNGTILWNVSYSSDASVNSEGIDCLWTSIADILKKTNFMIADKIVWKKKSALPNNVSHNKLTRICEEVFVFCRKAEYKTFYANKEISSIGKNGQTFYKPIYNFIEAANNDGSTKLNKATYSSDLCVQLLNIYAPQHGLIFDPFMGTGTTGIACEMLDLNCIGTELSEAQVEYSNNRLKEYRRENGISSK
jgi:DNA modification methylase